MKTDVVIIGAGPSGLMLGHLLAQAGVNAVILERKSGEYVLGRIRAGVLEQGTINIMTQLGLDTRLQAEGISHDYVSLTDRDKLIKIPVCQRRSKNLPDGGLKVGHCSGGILPSRAV